MAKRKQTRRAEYTREVKKLMNRIKRLAKSYDIEGIDIKIKDPGQRVTKRDVEYIKSFKRSKLQEAVKTVDYGTGELLSVKSMKQAEREAVSFAETTIDGWKNRVRELGGKLSNSLINFMSKAVDRLGAPAVSDALAKLDARGIQLTYKSVNYSDQADGYTTALLNSVDELGADSFTRQELEDAAQEQFYDMDELEL